MDIVSRVPLGAEPAGLLGSLTGRTVARVGGVIAGLGGPTAYLLTRLARNPTPPERAYAAAWILLGVFLALLHVLTAGHGGLPGIVTGADNRYSTSKVQTALWTLIIGFGVALTAGMAVFDPRLDAQTLFGSGLKGEYLALLGGPFAAALVAKGVVSSKVSRGQLEKTSADAPSLLDVAAGDDGTLELADTQYLLFNLIAMGYVLATLLPHPARGLPAIPGTILGLTGASTLGYLGNKAFDSNVPLVASVIPAVAGIAEQVEIRGSNLLSAVGSGAGAATTVLFNGVASPAVEVAGNALKAVVPAGLAPGPADVTVVTPSGLSSLAKPIRVTEPAVPSGEGDGSDH